MTTFIRVPIDLKVIHNKKDTEVIINIKDSRDILKKYIIGPGDEFSYTGIFTEIQIHEPIIEDLTR